MELSSNELGWNASSQLILPVADASDIVKGNMTGIRGTESPEVTEKLKE